MAGTGQHFVDDDKKAAYLNCQWWVCLHAIRLAENFI
jgi:hypothetical protein